MQDSQRMGLGTFGLRGAFLGRAHEGEPEEFKHHVRFLPLCVPRLLPLLPLVLSHGKEQAKKKDFSMLARRSVLLDAEFAAVAPIAQCVWPQA